MTVDFCKLRTACTNPILLSLNGSLYKAYETFLPFQTYCNGSASCHCTLVCNACSTYFAGTSRQTRWPRYFDRVLWRERNRSGVMKTIMMAVGEWEFDDSVAFQLCNQIAEEMSTKLAHLSCKHYLVCAFRGSQLQLITFQLSVFQRTILK